MTNISFGLEIEEKCIETDALRLHFPDFKYRAYGGNKVINMGEKITWGGREGTKGFLEKVVQIKKWAIIESANGWRSDKVYELWEQYCSMRGFDARNGPICEPQVIKIDFRRGTSEFVKIAQKKWDLIFLILPNGAFGSEIKAKFTKIVQSQRTASKGTLIQCIMESNAGNKSAVLGAFEDSLAKVGNILYEIMPQGIEKSSPYYGKLNKIWTIGLDVSHTTQRQGGKPSVAMMCLQTHPFKGTHRGMTNIAHLNKARTEIIPFAATVTMIYEALMKQIKYLQNDKTRPEIIMVFRDGLPDNALKEAHSKELVGIARGIRMVRDRLKSEFKIKWKPKLQFIICSKSPIEKFGIRSRYNNRSSISPLQFPAVVFRGITSTKLWDFFMWNYHPNKRSKIDMIKPLRYVVLKDELKLCEQNGRNGPLALFEIINALFYTYCFAIPFPLGGTSQPGPIVYAKHYAETFSQMILSNDHSLNDLKISNNLKTRPQIITKLMQLPDIINGNGNENGKGNGNGGGNPNDTQ